MPTLINIGTRIGASSAHFADADGTRKSMAAVSSTMPRIVTAGGIAADRSVSAPWRAMRAPMFESANAFVKSAAKKTMTM